MHLPQCGDTLEVVGAAHDGLARRLHDHVRLLHLLVREPKVLGHGRRQRVLHRVEVRVLKRGRGREGGREGGRGDVVLS